MFNKILVALDSQESCDSLFEKARTLAQATQADLVVLSVLAPDGDAVLPLLSYPAMNPAIMGYPLTATDAVWDEYQRRYEAYKAKSLAMLTRYCDQAIAAGIQAKLSQETGEPGRVICDVAKAENADLIIVGSHGRKGLAEFLIGSVSSYVMHRAPCSVLVVHPKASSQTKPPESVLSPAC